MATALMNRAGYDKSALHDIFGKACIHTLLVPHEKCKALIFVHMNLAKFMLSMVCLVYKEHRPFLLS